MNQRSSPSPLREEALHVVRVLRAAGFETYWVGGCVRDTILGRPPKDYDVATSASPDRIAALFPRVLDVGQAFGVMRVLQNGEDIEVATFREDLPYRDGRHPEGVRFSSPEADARRRDFTINGLFYDPMTGRILDWVGGERDIEARIVRAIGDPERRFSEDYLRMLRAVRFASTLSFEIEPNTAEAIRRLAGRIVDVSAERIQAELTRLLVESPHAGQGIRLMQNTGLLPVILPEVSRMIGQEQPPAFHPEGDVFTHTVHMLDALDHPSVTLAYAALLHDVGKPVTAYVTREPDGSERIRFDFHAREGAILAESILRRLKMPTQVIEDTRHCVGNHMRFMEVQKMRPSTLRKLAGAPTFADELELHRLDCLCSHGGLDNHAFLEEFLRKLKDEKNEPALPPPWIDGRDILALGVPEGREVGAWLRKAYEAQLENRFENREALLEWLKQELTS